ncbi:MAG: sigma-70 family RNA polymerase sigma factor [Candidatus Eisenbacteria bacterium]|uniref:Sigma-70 family RNA polymerase sigma factor n=1 Tax=Eiseniibacteriota bacterium TaxID=2212470 RepID=A0A956M3K6_UNCEI|nr:sigma-70 family RNA polymerase sigma factor [Candidatus Eisenbacteria bacterium]
MDHDPGDSALPASTPEALVEQYRSFVTALAKKILKSLPSFVELEDLEAYGTIGLIESSRRFDPSRGVQFKTFAYYRIRGAIYDGIRKMAWFEKEPNADVVYEAASNEVLSDSSSAQRSDRGQSTLDDDIAQTRTTILRLAGARLLSLDHESIGEVADPSQNPEAAAELLRVAALLRESIAQLDEKERSVVEDYYFHHKTLEEAGAKLGLSKSWTCRVHARALKNLAALCQNRGIESPP